MEDFDDKFLRFCPEGAENGGTFFQQSRLISAV